MHAVIGERAVGIYRARNADLEFTVGNFQFAVFLRLIDPLNLVSDRRRVDLAETAVTTRRRRGFRFGVGYISSFSICFRVLFGFGSLLGRAFFSQFARALSALFQTAAALLFFFHVIERAGLLRRAEAEVAGRILKPF